MTIINSSTTGHNLRQERKFSNKLFIGLIALVIAAIAVFLIAGQNKELDPVTTPAEQATSTSDPVPVEQQPRN